jgi:hypothetical protein
MQTLFRIILLTTLLSLAITGLTTCTDYPAFPTLSEEVLLVYPENDAVITENPPTFQWSAWESVEQYELVIFSYPVSDGVVDTSVNAREGVVINGDFDISGDTVSYQVKGILPHSYIYRWYVRARTATRYYESETFSFTIEDVIPPTVWVTSPLEGSEISGEVLISGTASDNDRIEQVEIRLDGSDWIIATGRNQFAYTWDTTYEFVGEHLIEVRSLDGNEMYSEIAEIRVYNNEFEDTFEDDELAPAWTEKHFDETGEIDIAGAALQINNGSAGAIWSTPDQVSGVYMQIPEENFTALINVRAVTVYKNTGILGLWLDAELPNSERYLIQSDSQSALPPKQGYERWGISSRTSTGGSVAWDNLATAVELIYDFYIRVIHTNGTYSFSYSLDGETFSSFLGANPVIPSAPLKHLMLLSAGDSGNVDVIFNSVKVSLNQ